MDPSWDEYHEKRITLGGLVEHLAAIRRGRRVMFVACGTSFHACLACRQTVEELAEVPVRARQRPGRHSLSRLQGCVQGLGAG